MNFAAFESNETGHGGLTDSRSLMAVKYLPLLEHPTLAPAEFPRFFLDREDQKRRVETADRTTCMEIADEFRARWWPGEDPSLGSGSQS
jgi:hypothetical protein